MVRNSGRDPRKPGGWVFAPLAFVTFLSAAFPSLLAGQTVTEFAIPTANSKPDGITTGSDGNLWFTEQVGNRIGQITPSGAFTEFSAGISASSLLEGITAGPDDNLWFTEINGPRIGRITPLGAVTEFSVGITVGAAPMGITAGPDGNVWFTEYGLDRIGRITPLGAVTEFSVGITAGAKPHGITAGPDGNLWFTEESDRIGQITTSGFVTEFGVGITAGARPIGITAGPDGNLWFAEYNGQRIGQITPSGSVTEFSAGITSSAGPWGITAGPDGNLWFTEANVDRIGRITPLGAVTEFGAGITVGATPYAIAAGPDGNLWFTEQTGSRIGRFALAGSSVVTNLNDSGAGSLRQAIIDANLGACGDPCTITFAASANGTIFVTSGPLTITSNIIINGNGAFTTVIDGNNSSGVFLVSSGTVSMGGMGIQGGNSSTGGGGIFVGPGAFLSLSANVQNNSAPGASGGGIYNAGTVLLGGFVNNNNAQAGGGLFNSSTGSAQVSADIYANSTSGQGGGIDNQGTLIIVFGASLASNVAGTDGGGLYNEASGTTTIFGFGSVTIDGNSSGSGAFSYSGGGIYNAGTLTVSGTTISNNQTPATVVGQGGGLYNTGAAHLTNTTVSDNFAFSFAGGIFSSGTLTLDFSTVAGNTGAGGNNGVTNSGGSATLTSSIVAYHNNNCSGSISSGGHNVSSDASCSLTGPGDQNSTDPLLDPLGYYGGPLSIVGGNFSFLQTRRLRAGSPAIDTTPSCGLATDQRGVPRPQGPSCDSGASEYTTAIATHYLILLPASAAVNALFDGTVKAVNDADAPVASYTGTVIFDGLGYQVAPNPYDFTAADAGSHTFTSGFSFASPGTQQIFAEDPATNYIQGFSSISIVSSTQPPTISKAFGAPSVALNGTTSLTFTITNPNSGTSLSGVGFNDNLPAGLVVATPSGLVGACGGGTITAVAGSGSASLATATLAASASCSFSVNVTATAAGVQNNLTSNVTSIEGGNGGPASASLTVCPVITVTPALLPGGTVGAAYSQTLTGNGGSGPYTFAQTGGALPTNLALSAAGVLSGSPTATGSFTFTVTATDANGCMGSQSYTVVVCGTITLSPASLPGGSVGNAYSQTITASGGTGPYSFTRTGTLPGGLALSAAGVLSGTPTAAGSFAFTVTATDANGCSGSQSYTVVICPAITLSPASLPGGALGSAYNQTITASGGTGPYAFTRTAGSLPPGLSLSAAGVLSGTPTANGPSTFTVTATDANGCAGSRSYTVTVGCTPVTLSPAALPGGSVGSSYSVAVTATGGTGPYAFALASGSLPSGLTFTAAGLLSGSPTTPGSYSFDLSATDAMGCAGTASYTINISGCPSIDINPASLPNARVGVFYSRTLAASGGAAPYTFSLTSGSLPAGLSLTQSGLLSGTPTATTGIPTPVFTVTATDSLGCKGSRGFPIAVSNCSTITTLPAALPNGSLGAPYRQVLSATGGVGPYTFTLTSGSLPPGLTLSPSGVIAGTPTSAGDFAFRLTATDFRGCVGVGDYSVRIVLSGFTISDLTPDSAISGSGLFTLTVDGLGFVPGSAVTWNGSPRTTTFVSATRLTAAIPATDVAAAATVQVTVVNPGPIKTTPAAFTVCDLPGAPSDPQIANASNPGGPVTGADPLLLSWGAPNTGPAPRGYEYRINGDAYAATTTTSVTAPARGSNDPIQLFVRALSCVPDSPGPEVSTLPVAPAAPGTDFAVPSDARVGQPATFTDTSSPQATSWLWIFDDEETSTLQSPTHVFTEAGNHKVALIASNGSGSKVRIQSVSVEAAGGGSRTSPTSMLLQPDQPGRSSLRWVRLSGSGRTWLILSSGSAAEEVVFLRLVDSAGAVRLERRLVLEAGEEAVHDIGAWGVTGTFEVEIVGSGRAAARLRGADLVRERVVPVPHPRRTVGGTR